MAALPNLERLPSWTIGEAHCMPCFLSRVPAIVKQQAVNKDEFRLLPQRRVCLLVSFACCAPAIPGFNLSSQMYRVFGLAIGAIR